MLEPDIDTCEVKVRGEWVAVTIEDALRLDRDRLKRCSECHGRVRAHARGQDGMRPHFEHFERHSGCSKGDCFSGEKSYHRKRMI